MDGNSLLSVQKYHCPLSLQSTLLMWWVDVGQLPDPHQSAHSPASKGQGKKVTWKSSRVEIMTVRSLNSYCDGQNKLREINIIES